MVMAPERPPRATESAVPPAWKWLAVGLLVLLAVAGVALWLLADGDSAAEGVGPVGPIGPAGPTGSAGGDAVVGSGTIVTESRPLAGFDAIVLAGEGEVVIVQADEFSASLTTDDNLLPFISTEVIGSTLYLDKVDRQVDIDPTEGVVLELAAPTIKLLEVAGAGSIEIGELRTEGLTMTITGTGLIEVQALEAVSLSVDGVGSGSFEVAGMVERQVVELRGVVSYTAPELQSSSAVVRSAGIEPAVIWVTDSLDVTISDLGSVEYYGEPALTSEITGSGQISALGTK